ncbi:LysR family transcriptional regulator [Halomonas denitrificans]|nr:LysR substrate-binding domain-containing protein [Halomonas denitrificans]MCA0973970.1 LysR family transcriptional regulator [Halomonas denitrificans]
MRHLRCVVEVARTRNAAQAAQALNITPSAVSKTLREVEEIAGIVLFTGSRRGTQPTPEGARLIERINLALSTLQAGFEQLPRYRGEGVTVLKIGSLPIFAAKVLPVALSRLARECPGVQVQIASGVRPDMLDKLRRGDIDMMFGRLPPPEDLAELVFQQLLVDRYLFVVRAGHPLLARQQRLDDVLTSERFPLLLPTRETVTWTEIARMFKARGLALPQHRIETVDVNLSLALTMNDDAIWAASELMVADRLCRGELVELALETDLLQAPLGVITGRDWRGDFAARALIDICGQLSRDELS